MPAFCEITWNHGRVIGNHKRYAMHASARPGTASDFKGLTTLLVIFRATIGTDPRFAFYVILILTALLTEMMTNNAAAALMFPIALSASVALGIDHMPFVMAVIFGANASFLTPHAYQSNLMVMSPGGYRLRDYLRAGTPVSLTYLLLAAWLVPMFFPF